MEVIVICNEIVDNCEVSKLYKTTLSALSEKDYSKNYGLSDSIRAIDLDSYERCLSNGNAKCTMDAAIGIADLHERNKKNKRLLLVEMKFGVKIPQNLSIKDLKNKVKHSRELLGGNAIERVPVFLFDNSCVQTAKNIIKRVFVPCDVLVCTAKEFTELYIVATN